MTSPIPLFDWKPIIPPSRSVSTSVGARSGGQGGPQARARQCALSLTVASTPTRSAISGAAKISIQRLTGNTVSTAITLYNGNRPGGQPGPSTGCPANAAAASRRDSRLFVGIPGASRLFGGRCRAGWWRR
jgi:hypothetical protein